MGLNYGQLMKGGDAFWVPYVILKHQSLPYSEHMTDTFKESRPSKFGRDFCYLKVCINSCKLTVSGLH